MLDVEVSDVSYSLSSDLVPLVSSLSGNGTLRYIVWRLSVLFWLLFGRAQISFLRGFFSSLTVCGLKIFSENAFTMW